MLEIADTQAVMVYTIHGCLAENNFLKFVNWKSPSDCLILVVGILLHLLHFISH